MQTRRHEPLLKASLPPSTRALCAPPTFIGAKDREDPTDPDKAPLVRGLFERHATGHESDRSLAARLNAHGARTTRDREFSKDMVREMPCNTAYAGWVGSRAGILRYQCSTRRYHGD